MLKRETWESAGVIAAMAAVILIPALLNGFPFVDYDSMSYLSTAYGRVIPENRPVYYSIFTLALDWAINPWPIALAQALIVATGIWHVARTLFGLTDWRVLLGVAAMMTAATSMPWYAAYMTPDVFTPILIGALLVIGLGWDRLSLVARLIYGAVIAACVAFHYGNMAISLGANLVFAAIALLGWRPAGAWRSRFIAMNGAIGLGLLALFAATTYDHGKPALSPSGSTFYLARLMDDGSALKVMDRDCARVRWHTCAELPVLNAYAANHRAHPEDPRFRESVADFFLWGGSLQRLGDFEAVEPEAGKIVRAAWGAYPGEQLSATLHNALAQATSFRFGEFLHSWGEREPYPTIRRMFGDGVAGAYQHSLQERGLLRFGVLNGLAFALIAASLVFLAYAALQSYRGDKRYFYLSVALLCFLLGNAFTTGVVSGVFANYQARVMWLLPLFALLTAAQMYWKPKPV